jgi:hypothetical protein
MKIQQGDVIIRRTNEEIKGKKLNHLILAEGETSGHMHRVSSGIAELYLMQSTLYLKVISDTAIITHEEHKPVVLEKGDYSIGIVKEWDYEEEEAKKVRD